MELVYADLSVACGFKLGLEHPPEGHESWSSAWDWLAERKDIRVIWLTRPNWLAQSISGIIAAQTKQWHADDPLLRPENRPRIRIDPEQAARAYRRHSERLERVRERFAGHPSLDVTYEELIGDWIGTTAGVQRFLNVPMVSLPQKTVRGERRPVEDVTENYAELTVAAEPARPR